MEKKVLIVFLLAVILMVAFLVSKKSSSNDNPSIIHSPLTDNPSNTSVQNNPSSKDDLGGFVSPLSRSGERVTKKPFGIYVTPQNSPTQPEHFSGYHTGADFEIFPEELSANVPVKAVCEGELRLKKYAQGYGGVVVEDCTLNGNPITVIYGHLKLASVQKNVGDDLSVGEAIGILGADKSVETNGERKHLHLGFNKGPSLNILGYVQDQNELSGWLNPCDYGVCQ